MSGKLRVPQDGGAWLGGDPEGREGEAAREAPGGGQGARNPGGKGCGALDGEGCGEGCWVGCAVRDNLGREGWREACEVPRCPAKAGTQEGPTGEC